MLNTPLLTQLRNSAGLLGIAVLFGGCAHTDTVPFPAPQTAAPPAALLPVWQPNPVMVGQLSPETSLKEYALRLPPGYVPLDAALLKNLQPYALDLYLWQHTGDAPTLSFFDVTVIRRANSETPANVLDKVVDSVNQRYGADFSRSKTEVGSINSLPFARTYWQRIEKRESGSMITSGFTYATVTGEKGVFIEASDMQPCPGQPCSYQPGSSSQIPVLEAAVLTFRQQ